MLDFPEHRATPGRGEWIDGIFLDIRTSVVLDPPRPALVLDRDGVLVDFVDYLHRPRDVHLADGAANLVRAFNDAGVPVVVATNQAGIGRGRYPWEDFHAVEAEITRQLACRGARLDAVAACPFHPEGVAPYRHPDHPGRKPNPGMLTLLARRLRLDLATSWMVGDHITDVQAAERAGLAGVVQVLAGHGATHRAEVELRSDLGRFAFTADSLADAGRRLFAAFRIQ